MCIYIWEESSSPFFHGLYLSENIQVSTSSLALSALRWVAKGAWATPLPEMVRIGTNEIVGGALKESCSCFLCYGQKFALELTLR